MLTPLDVQKHQFTVKFKGFDREEVRHFLYAVSEELEKLVEKNQRLSQELALVRERVKDMASREKALKDTLITAQQIKADFQENAEKEAELIIKEAQLKSDRFHERAKEKVDDLHRQISELRRVRNDILAETEMMVSRFTHFVDAEREMALENDKLQSFITHKKPKATRPIPQVRPETQQKGNQA